MGTPVTFLHGIGHSAKSIELLEGERSRSSPPSMRKRSPEEFRITGEFQLLGGARLDFSFNLLSQLCFVKEFDCLSRRDERDERSGETED